MKTACLTFNPIQENTYVVWDDTLECVVVDAGNSTERENAALRNFIEQHGLKPVAAVNTHGHFDHVLGVEWLRRTYGIPFALSSKDRFLLDGAETGSTVYGVKVGAMPSVDLDLDEEPEIRFGRTSLQVIPTPGHTPGHVSLYEPESKTLFTGDTLFRESIGRTDLPGGGAAVQFGHLHIHQDGIKGIGQRRGKTLHRLLPIPRLGDLHTVHGKELRGNLHIHCVVLRQKDVLSLQRDGTVQRAAAGVLLLLG